MDIEGIQDILNSGCNSESIKNLHTYMKTYPANIDKHISEILPYIFSIDCEINKEDYELLLVELFTIYGKLHRVQNLIAKMIPEVKKSLSSKTISTKCTLPILALQTFEKCVIPMASWQIINLLKTFIFHLGTVVTDDFLCTESGIDETLYVDFICTLLCSLLSSVRMAEHSISDLVLEKFLKALDEIKQLLGKFGTYLVNMEHNPKLMRSFLKTAYIWADVCIILKYYSIDGIANITFSVDNDFAPSNLTYLHSYLSIDQWALISERIANFGEVDCKTLLEKLIIQKIRAMSVFNDLNDEVIEAIIKTIPIMDKSYKEVSLYSYVIKSYIDKLDLLEINQYANVIIQRAIDTKSKPIDLFDDNDKDIWIYALLYACFSGINKLFKRQKRKRDSVGKTLFHSERIFKLIPIDNNAIEENLSEMIEFTNSLDLSNQEKSEYCISDDCVTYLNIIKILPLVFLNENIQSTCYFFLSALLTDFHNISSSDGNGKIIIQQLLLGLLQHGKVKVKNLGLSSLHKFIITNINDYKTAYQYALNCFLKYDNVSLLEEDVNLMCENIQNEKYLQCTLLFLSYITKFKNLKSSTSEDKKMLTGYKEKICSAIIQTLIKNSPATVQLIEPYSIVLKNSLNAVNDQNIKDLLELLDNYIENALNNSYAGLKLFIVILQDNIKVPCVNDELILKIWKLISSIRINKDSMEDYSKLIPLIFEHISNESFQLITNDLLNNLNEAKTTNKWDIVQEQLHIMGFALQCNFNPVRGKIWTNTIEFFLQDMISILSTNKADVNIEKLYIASGKFCEMMIKSFHDLSPLIIDMSLIMCTLLMTRSSLEFMTSFSYSMKILETLLKDKKPLMMSRLPSFLQQYRILLNQLCKQSDTELHLEIPLIQQLADCAHQMERLTKNIVTCTKDMERISPFLVCDILKIFEEISIYAEVKMHLKNCLYSIISLCDKHAIKFVYRNTSCIEILNDIMENAKKLKYKGKI